MFIAQAKVAHIDCSGMENYIFKEKYDAIIMWFCAKNLDKKALLDFLKQAKA